MTDTFFIKYVRNLVTTQDITENINYLRQRGVLLFSIECLSCSLSMRQVKRKEAPDSYAFRCCNSSCTKFQNYRSIRSNSFLENFKISLSDFIYVVYLYSRENTRDNINDITGISLSIIYKIIKKIRIRIENYFILNPIILGGSNVIIQIDESKFNFNVKNHRGLAPVEPIWVFGIVDTSFRPARGYMKVVERRDRETLCDIIASRVRQGSIIFSDEWRAYSNISELGFMHGTVCHKFNFVNPDSGVHTQNIESYWNRQKLRIKKIKGVKKGVMNEILDEFMFFDFFYNNVFDALIDKIIKI